jgi:hypothetical protein
VFTAPYLAVELPLSVLVGVEVRGLRDVASTPSSPRRLEVTYAVDSASARVANRVVTLSLSDGDTARRSVAEGARILAHLALPAGHYTLQVSVRDTADGRVASSSQTLDVPTLRDTPITMSGVVMAGSKTKGVTMSPEEDEDRTLLITGQPPVARREFSRTEQVEVNAEIYLVPPAFPDDDIEQQLRITTSVTTPDGRIVYESTDAGQGETLPSGVYGYWHYALVPVSTLAPGSYVVWVTAVDGAASASRSLPITITR